MEKNSDYTSLNYLFLLNYRKAFTSALYVCVCVYICVGGVCIYIFFVSLLIIQ